MDWTAALLPASFNGQAFFVERAKVEAGHRVAKTYIPNGGYILESFGPTARAFEVEAYLTGPFCLARAAALVASAERSHRGVMVLPDSGPATVRLIKARRAFDKDKLGFVAVELEAVAERADLAAGLSIGALASAVFGAVGGLVGLVSSYAAAAIRLVGLAAPVVEAAILAGVRIWGDLVAIRDALRLPAEALAAVGPAFDAVEAASGSLASEPAVFYGALVEAAIALGDAGDPATVLATIVSLGQPPEPPVPAVSSGTAVAIARNDGEALAVQATMRAAIVVEALARAEFRDRPEAVAARLAMVAIVDDAARRLGPAGVELAAALRALRGLAGELITRRAAGIAPLINVSAGRPLPALWWAWTLYADPLRADELRARVRAPHPAALPVSFEALSA
ncbi:DNA circularization protein [Microcystis phage vB_MweS-yong2]|nr:DNA circularization protein [Microcystis phage vB_MweS-yong2]